MSNTLEKQLRAEVLKRQQEKKQQERIKPRKNKMLILLAAIATLSLVVSLSRWQMAKSAPAQLNQPAPRGEGQSPNAYELETI